MQTDRGLSIGSEMIGIRYPTTDPDPDSRPRTTKGHGLRMVVNRSGLGSVSVSGSAF